MHLPLINNYTLIIEPHLKNSVRLVVLSNGEEIACRKESIKNLNHFIELNEGSIFKGRIRLYKTKACVAVHFKESKIGVLPVEILSQSLNIKV